ncbi:cell adhesion molecule 3-like [Clinocottus analis]|uniref:cell adhesion molecule 3-like n=1 Tax=Clinocottus analis TaxID=304258 RepID=UPI0035C1E9EC
MRWFFLLSSVVLCAGQPVNWNCPVQMKPPSAVVRFGDSFSVNCSSPSDQIESMGVESIYGSAGGSTGNSSVLLNVESVTDWKFRPICFLNHLHLGQCSKVLQVIVYKTPDTVSMSWPESLKGPLVEGERYSIQCDIVNVAPVRNLSVHWHKGDSVLYTETFDGSSQSPVNATSVFNLTARRGDDETRIWCEAQLDLPTPVPDLHAIKSEFHDVIVLYAPAFVEPNNETLELSAASKLVLNCTAAGKPTPAYSWRSPWPVQRTNHKENQSVLAPSIQRPGTYECTASNSQGSTTKYFTVTEATRSRTTFAALVGAVALLGVGIVVLGFLTLTPEGTFSFSKGGYLKGRPTSSGPI